MNTVAVKSQIDEIVSKITDYIHPERIILFGSFAQGTANEDSDLDLLVIVPDSSLPRYKRSVPIYKMLSGYNFSKDILVYTQQEIDKYKDIQNTFVYEVLNTGRVVYSSVIPAKAGI